MSCVTQIAKDISNCSIRPVAGYEATAWILNLDEFTYTIASKNLVTSIAMVEFAVSYSVNAIKREMNGGFEAQIQDIGDDIFGHSFSFKPFEKDAESVKNIDDANGLVVIAELKGVKSEGCFVVLGMEAGMYKVSGSQRGNEGNGLPSYEYRSVDGIGEKYSRWVLWDTDYQTTKDMILGLLPGSGGVIIYPGGTDEVVYPDGAGEIEYPDGT